MISVSPRRVFRVLLGIVLGLCLANLSAQFARYFLGRGALWGFTRVIDIDYENTIPAWYSSVALLLCSVLLAMVALTKRQQRDRFKKHWAGLSAIFLLFSIDEAASLHELLIEPVRNLLKADGYFYFAWVIPGIAFVLLVTGLYWKFLANLPVKTRNLFVLAGAIFVGGAIGVEMLGGNYLQENAANISYENFAGWRGMGVALILTLEEALEMIGVAIFVYALLDYMRNNSREFKVIVSDRPAEPALDVSPERVPVAFHKNR